MFILITKDHNLIFLIKVLQFEALKVSTKCAAVHQVLYTEQFKEERPSVRGTAFTKVSKQNTHLEQTASLSLSHHYPPHTHTHTHHTLPPPTHTNTHSLPSPFTSMLLVQGSFYTNPKKPDTVHATAEPCQRVCK